MEQEFKDAVITALDDGRYLKAEGQLGHRDSCGNEYRCGLGVIGEVAVQFGLAKREDTSFDDGLDDTDELHRKYLVEYGYGLPSASYTTLATLPNALLESIGLSINDSVIIQQMNDREGKTLPEIAVWVKENVS